MKVIIPHPSAFGHSSSKRSLALNSSDIFQHWYTLIPEKHQYTVTQRDIRRKAAGCRTSHWNVSTQNRPVWLCKAYASYLRKHKRQASPPLAARSAILLSPCNYCGHYSNVSNIYRPFLLRRSKLIRRMGLSWNVRGWIVFIPIAATLVKPRGEYEALRSNQKRWCDTFSHSATFYALILLNA